MGCAGVDVVRILEKKRQKFTGIEVRVSKQNAPEPPWTIEKIEIEWVVAGQNLREKAVRDAVRLSEEKYCSVSASLTSEIVIHQSDVINEDEIAPEPCDRPSGRRYRVAEHAGLPPVPGSGLRDHTRGGLFRAGACALMLVGQAPGVTEVEASGPLTPRRDGGCSSGWPRPALRRPSFAARYYMTAVTKCYPGKHPKGKGDRKPSRAEQKLCRPFLDRELALVQPRVLLAVGGLAIETLLGRKLRLDEAVGRVFEVDGRWSLAPAPPVGRQPVAQPAREPGAASSQAMAILREDLAPLRARLTQDSPDPNMS